MPRDELQPPEAFAAIWPVLGWIAVLLILAWLGSIWWFGRQRQPQPAAVSLPPPVPVVDVASARQRALTEITRIRRAQGMSSRQAHQQLSLVVRRFVTEASAVPVDTMTLDQLRLHQGKGSQWGRLYGWMAAVQPPEFAPAQERPVSQSCDEAEGLVSQWC